MIQVRGVAGVLALVVGLVITATPAAAERHSAGFDLEPLAVQVSVTARPIWADGQQGIVVQEPRPPQMGGGSLGRLACVTAAGGFSYFDLAVNNTTVIAARRGQADFVRVDVNPAIPAKELIRQSCTSAPQSLGSYVFPAALAPVQTDHPWLLDEMGAIYYPSVGGLAKLALSPAPLATALVTHAEMQTAFGIAGVTPSFGISAITAFPDGRLVFVVYLRDNQRTDWLVERASSGTLTVRWSQRSDTGGEPLRNAVYDSGLDAVLFDPVTVFVGPLAIPYRSLGILPAVGPPDLTAPVPPWPVFGQSVIGGAAGTYSYLAAQTEPQPLSRLVYDAGLADFDRDGLRAAKETLLGTSDFRTDSDGDGLGDLAEVNLLATDPANAASAVPAATLRDDVVLGASLFARYQPLGGATCRPVSTLSFGRVLCEGVDCAGMVSQGTCKGPDLVNLPHTPGHGALMVFPYAPAGVSPEVAFDFNLATSMFDAIALATGTRTPLPRVGASTSTEMVPISANHILLIERSATSDGWVWRVGTDGSKFAVLDNTRTDCPIVANPGELARCGAPDLFGPRPMRMRLVGFEPTLRMALLAVTTEQGSQLLGIDAATVTILADLTTLTDGLDLTSVLPMSEGGAKGYVLSLSSNATIGVGMKRVDAVFAPIAGAQPFVSPDGAGTFFQRGFAQTQAVSYVMEPRPTGCGCMSGGGTFNCDTCPMQMFGFVVTGNYPAEWIPVAPAIEKGEVIFWSGGRYPAITVRVRDRLTGRYNIDYATGWILWRTTPLGATLEWLEGPELVAKLTPADAASVATTPLGAITAMSASPDGLKLCLAESAAARVWELALDPMTRVLASARLAATGAAAGCAYDDTGRLAWLGGSPTAIRWDGGSISVAAVTAPSGLHRFDARWIVQAHRETARCVDDAGGVSDAAVQLTALGSAPGGIVYLDAAGDGYVSTPERLCTGMPSPERLIGSKDANTWSLLNEFQTFRSTTANRGVIAMRPDGVAFLGASDIAVGGIGDNPSYVTKVMFHLFPQFVATAAGPRITALDPFRLIAPIHSLGHLRAANVEAMTIIPGAAPSRDWGYDTRPGTPAPIVDPPGGGDAGVDSPPPPTAGGCGCGTSEPPPAGLLLLAMWLLHGHRRIRARRTP